MVIRALGQWLLHIPAAGKRAILDQCVSQRANKFAHTYMQRDCHLWKNATMRSSLHIAEGQECFAPHAE